MRQVCSWQQPPFHFKKDDGEHQEPPYGVCSLIWQVATKQNCPCFHCRQHAVQNGQAWSSVRSILVQAACLHFLYTQVIFTLYQVSDGVEDQIVMVSRLN